MKITEKECNRCGRRNEIGECSEGRVPLLMPSRNICPKERMPPVISRRTLPILHPEVDLRLQLKYACQVRVRVGIRAETRESL